MSTKNKPVDNPKIVQSFYEQIPATEVHSIDRLSCFIKNPIPSNIAYLSSIKLSWGFFNNTISSKLLLVVLLLVASVSSTFAQDADGDGVVDSLDYCVNAGGVVNALGCPFPVVCDTIETTNISFDTSGLNPEVGYITIYVLADSQGLIVDTSSAPQFVNVTAGKYMVIALDYDDDGSIANFAVGDTLDDVTANCYDWSDALTYRICPTEICGNAIDDDEDGLTDCDDPDCQATYSAVAVYSEAAVTTSANAIGIPDLATADIEADIGELILDLGQVIPQGAVITLDLKYHVTSGGSVPVADVEGSASPAGPFTNLITYNTLTTAVLSYKYTVIQVGGIQYLRIQSRALSGNSTDQFVDVDAITFPGLPVVTFTLPDIDVCQNSLPITLSGGTPIGGVYSGTGVTNDSIFSTIAAGPGLHTITYTFTDVNGCSVTATDDITVYELPTITLLNKTGPSTTGGNDGSIDISVSGGLSPYTYNWSNGATTEDISGLMAGTYQVTITETDNACSETRGFTITDLVTNTVTGTVFEDFNRNSILDGPDTGPAGINVIRYEDVNTDGLVDAGDIPLDTVTTIAGGNFTFDMALDYNVSGSYNQRIIASADDARSNSGGNLVTTTDLGLKIGSKVVGLRFQGVTIPSGSTITSAYLSFTAYGSQSGSLTVDIWAEDNNNAAAFVEVNDDITSRSTTTSFVNWTPPDWTAETVYNSPDLSTIVQEVVDNQSGLDNDPLVFITNVTNTLIREPYSYDGDPLKAPLLVINYTGTGSSTHNFVFQTDTLTLPANYYFTTDNVEVANFTAVGQTDVNNFVGFAIPIATAGSNSPICAGDDLNLTESGGDAISWSWTGPNAFASAAQNPTITGATVLAAGNYTVTITDVNGRTATSTTNVTVNPAPAANATASSPACTGGNLLLNETGGGAVSWSWSGPSGASSNQQSFGLGSITLANAGIYSVTVTDVNGCTAISTVNVTVYTSPTATAGSNSPICEGEDINLTESAGDAVSWSWTGPNTFTSTAQNPTVSAATAAANGNYTVTITDGNGCTAASTVNVTVNALPVVSLTLADTDDCVDNNTLALSGGAPGGGTYSGTGVTGTNFDASVAGTGAHTITYTYTDVNGCTNSATEDITVYGLPIVTYTIAGDDLACLNDPPLNITGGSPGGGTYSGPGVSGTTLVPSIAGAGSHVVTYTYTDVNGCTNTATDNVTIFALPVVSLTLGDTLDCVANTTLALSGGSPGGGTYSGTGVTGSNFDASVAGVGVHTITYSYTDGNGCTDTATDDITVVALPAVSLSLPDTVDCISNNTLALSGGLPAGGTFSGTGVSGTNFDASIAGVGIHTITYTFTDGDGCVNSATDDIEVFALPVVTFTLTDDTDCINNTVFTLGGGSPAGGTYSGTGVSGGNFNATAAGLGVHTITYTYTDANGCTNTATDDLTVNSLPVVTLTLPDNEECVISTVLVLSGGSPGGGTFSGPGVTGTNFDASVAGVGVHSVIYSFTDVNGCTNTASNNVVVHGLPIVSLTLPNTEDCINNNTLALSGGTPTGGTYSGTGVTGTNFDASVAGIGIHTITYTYTDGNGCVNTDTEDITVYNQPVVTLTLGDTEECITSTTLALSGGSPAGGTYSGTGVSGGNFDASVAGLGSHVITYTYTDGSGCTNTNTDNIDVVGLPAVTLTLGDNQECVSNTTLALSGGSPGGGTYSGTGVSGGNFDASVAGIGTHVITYTYTDGSGCTNSDTDNMSVVGLPAVTLTLADTEECVSSTTLALSGGSPGGGTYSGSGVIGGNFDASTAGVGTHVITYTYTDGNGCVNTATDNMTVLALPVVSLSLPDIEECISSTTLALGGGSPAGGTYSGTGVSGSNFDASTAGVGTHTVTYSYTDANGCNNTATEDITVFALPTVTITLGINEDCFTNNTLLLSGGLPGGGTYSGTAVSGTNFDASVAGPGTHTITYTYTDGNGCTDTATEDITVYGFPTIDNVTPTDPVTCGGTEGTITITASGGTGSFEYRLDSGSWQSSNTFTGLGLGSYNVSVRYDNGLCETTYASNPVVLSDPPAISVSAVVTSNYLGEDITCVGAADGTAQATGSGGLAPYTYIWSNAQTGADLLNVVAGTYSVTATDDNGCQAVTAITLNDPPPLGATAVFTDVSCYGGSDGAIDVTAIGGVGAYTYSWNDLEPEAFWAFDGSTDDITGNDHHAIGVFGSEIYSGDAVDGNQSFDFDGGTIIQYDDDATFMESSFTEKTVLMWIKPDDLLGTEIIFDEGGTSHGIAMRISGDKLQGAVRSFSSQRTAYEMTIPNDGAWHQVGFVYDNGDFTLFLDGVLGTTNVTGFGAIAMLPPPFNRGGLGAKLGEDAFGGSNWAYPQFYNGLMDNVSYHNNALTSEQLADNYTDDGDRTGLPAGDYVVHIYDLNGCVDSISLTLNQPDSLALVFNNTNVSCNGGSDGAIDLVINGGVSPFTQLWSTGATTEDISGLVPGTYAVTITDTNGCIQIDSTTITEPDVLGASATATSIYSGFNVSCFGATDGTATATPTGGTSPYSYLWSNGQTTVNLINVAAGSYDVTVTDNNSCTTTTSVTITTPPAVTVSTAVSSNYGGEHISCVGATDGSATATASGGVGTYTYLWSNGQLGANLTNVGAGTYTVFVSDGNGCVTSGSITLIDPSPIVVTTSVTSDYNGADVSCAGDTDGSANASVSGGIGTYTYLWSNGQTTANLVSVGAGTYTVTVTDAFACTAIQTITLVNPTAVNTNINITSNYNGSNISCFGGSDGNATATGTGGVGGYSYLWSNGQSTANLTNVGAGNYTVTTTDANGCTSTASVTFTNPSPMNVTITSADPSDCGIDDGIILVSASGGVGTYEYSLDNITYQASNFFIGLGVGTYFIYVRNTFGTCVNGPNAVFINFPEAPTIDNITAINPTTGVSTDGGILVSASGNGLAIEYSLDGVSWQLSNLFSNLTVGTYTVRARYVGQNCISTTNVTLVAGGGVVGSGGGIDNYCSDDLSGVQFLEIYYIPLPEDQALTAFSNIYTPTCGSSNYPIDPVQSYVSIGVVESGSTISFDHWEDGFEPNLTFPIQSTTEIWGDGNAANGIPPGFTVDYLNAADIIVLNNAVTSTTRGAIIDYDGGDKIGSRGNLSITRLAWAAQSGTLLAGALEVYPTLDWGTNYEIPVGINSNVNNMFEYTGFVVMAAADNTTVTIDFDGDGSTDVTTVLNQGESYLQDGNASSGGTISATAPVQVDLLTGDICHYLETRFFTLKPTNQWSSDYYNPVATNSNDPTYVHLYNPSGASINVSWETNAGFQSTVAVPAKGTAFIVIPNNTGSHFYSTGGEPFYAVATIDSESGSNSTNDWGFALMPESQITSQINLVGFAPGQDPTSCTTTAISQAGWSIQYVDSEETVAGTHPGTNAIDGDDNTIWHTKWDGGSDPLPHEIQIDLGSTHDINGFTYMPRQDSPSSSTNLYASADVPKTITSSGTPTITSTLTIPSGGTIMDVDVINLDITHVEIKELTVSLTSPGGTTVVLLDNPCDNENDIYMSFDDEAATGSFPCPPTGGLTYRPDGNLSDFDGETSTGTWTLTVEDNKNNRGGSLDGWSLNIESGNTSTDGNIANYEFYVSADGVSWGLPRTTGTWGTGSSQQTETFPSVQGRYVRLVANSEVNGNPWTSAAEIGVLECAGGAENSAPVWITADYPPASASTGPITVCIDYNGDGGALVDANGVYYDATAVLNTLDNALIYDPDGNQTGMRLWVCDGSDAVIAGAWGQDPNTASSGLPAIDLGVGLPNGIPFATSKCVDLSKDYNSDGLFNECDEVIYTIIIRNTGALPLSVGALNIKDTLSSEFTYVENSTTSIVNGVVTDIPDDSSPASPFPLDENGINYSAVILPNDSIILRFEAAINDLPGATFLRNVAHVTNGQQELFPEVSFPVLEPTGAILTGIPPDTTLNCNALTSPPTIGTDIRPVNNCEEMDTIPQAGWSLQFVDSEDVTSGELAVNAFDGDPTTLWSTQWNGANPAHPHEIQIDLGATYVIGGFRYLPRQAGTNGMIEDYEFYVSEDGITWGTAQSTGTWTGGTSEEQVVFNLVTGRFVRLVATSEVNGNPWTAIGELNVLQCTNFAPVAIVLNEVSTQTSDGSPTDDCYNITRTWTATDHCGELSTYTQNIIVQDTIAPVLANIPADITVTTLTIPDAPLLTCAAPGNIAQGKPTSQSSTAVGGESARAVDGNTDGNFANGSVTLTNSEVDPWWEVDLQSVTSIDEIQIWNRTDCCAASLSNYYVLVSDFPFASTNLITTLGDPKVTSFYEGVAAGSPTTIAVDTTARYIRIQLQNTDALSLTEVIVVPACVSASDNCDPISNITFTEVIGPGTCAYDITRTWTATDNCGNISTASQVISVASTLTIATSPTSNYKGWDVSCNGSSDGTAEVTLSGGVSPISINWSNGQTGSTTINLSGGTHYVTVTDNNGCAAVDSVFMKEPSLIVTNTTITSNYNGEHITCIGANDGAAFVTSSGGKNPRTQLWSNGQTSAGATGLSAGTYYVTITDGNACTMVDSVTILNPPVLSVTASVSSAISCNGANDGIAQAVGAGGVAPYNYQWSDGQLGDTASGLSAISYTVTVTDANNCTATDVITLTELPTIVLTIAATSEPSLCGATDGSVTLSAIGGTGAYEYRLAPSVSWQGSNVFSGLASGVYDFYVRNSDTSCPAGPLQVTLTDPIPQSCPISATADSLVVCSTNVNVPFTVAPSPDATGYTWTAPAGTIIVYGQGTDSIEVNMNNVAVGNYSVCVVTNSSCGNSPPCCFTFDVITCSEICNNGIDDDEDGLMDCDDPDCQFTSNINVAASACIGDVVSISADDAGVGATYTWDFGTNASPATATGIGPHNVTYSAAGMKMLSLDISLNGCPLSLLDSIPINNCTAGLGDFVWQDDNEDGIQDGGEPGIEGVTVSLYDNTNTFISSTTTAADGSYILNSVLAGTYYIVFDPSTNVGGLTGYEGTLQNIGSALTDSDINPATRRTPLFLFNPSGGNILTLDAGFIISCLPPQRGGVDVIRK